MLQLERWGKGVSVVVLCRILDEEMMKEIGFYEKFEQVQIK